MMMYGEEDMACVGPHPFCLRHKPWTSSVYTHTHTCTRTHTHTPHTHTQGMKMDTHALAIYPLDLKMCLLLVLSDAFQRTSSQDCNNLRAFPFSGVEKRKWVWCDTWVRVGVVIRKEV